MATSRPLELTAFVSAVSFVSVIPVVLVVLLACLAPRPAAAWWDEGHMIVGEIAARRVSPPVRRALEVLLADLPDYASVATAATWPDREAKQDPNFDFAFSSHYVNVEARLSPRELHALCLQKAGCLATGVGYYAEVLRSCRASDSQRAEALRFLIHFVGDAHQPLHAGHGPDKGGNDIDQLRFVGAPASLDKVNLHMAWDGVMIAIKLEREGWDWQRYAVELDAGIDAARVQRWGRGGVYDWLEESRLFAAANGYLHADGMTPVRRGDTLGEDWYAHNLPVVEQRLQQGGVRLAAVLEELFADADADGRTCSR